MTKREFYTAVANGTVNDEVIAMAEDLIVKMDEANSKRAAKAAEKRAANTEFTDKFIGALTDEFQTATQLMEKLDGVIVREDGKALNPQFLARLAKAGIEDGRIVKGNVKVEGVKGTHVGYKLA